MEAIQRRGFIGTALAAVVALMTGRSFGEASGRRYVVGVDPERYCEWDWSGETLTEQMVGRCRAFEVRGGVVYEQPFILTVGRKKFLEADRAELEAMLWRHIERERIGAPIYYVPGSVQIGGEKAGPGWWTRHDDGVYRPDGRDTGEGATAELLSELGGIGYVMSLHYGAAFRDVPQVVPILPR